MNDAVCGICCEEYQADGYNRRCILLCGHKMCTMCIERLVQMQYQCAYCSAPVIVVQSVLRSQALSLAAATRKRKREGCGDNDDLQRRPTLPR